MKVEPIAIFGGTFDPVHNGHLEVAKEILARHSISQLRFVPCKQNVLKADAPQASDQQRLEMLQLAITDMPNCMVDDRELRSDESSYSVSTLESIRAETEPDQPIHLLLSSDAFNHFTRWHRYQDILQLANLIVILRPGHSLQPDEALQALLERHQTILEKDLDNSISSLIYIENIENCVAISSTEIRQRSQTTLLKKCTSSGDISQFLHPNVWQYICRHGLYKQG